MHVRSGIVKTVLHSLVVRNVKTSIVHNNKPLSYFAFTNAINDYTQYKYSFVCNTINLKSFPIQVYVTNGSSTCETPKIRITLQITDTFTSLRVSNLVERKNDISRRVGKHSPQFTKQKAICKIDSLYFRYHRINIQ